MKPGLIFLICFVYTCQLKAQQRPYYTQYILNNYIINPALAGIENYWDARASHRHQWVGLDGAPVTTYFSIQGPLKKNDFGRETATSAHTPGMNPRGTDYWKDYSSTDPHSGIGFTVINDKTGPLNHFEASATYAYHLPVGAQTSISGGISVGFQNMRLNTAELDFGTQYPVDPVVSGSGYLNSIKPDINVGVWLYSANYFVGIAAQQIVPEKVGFNGGKLGGDSVTVINGKLVPHIFLQAGYRFSLGEDLNLIPSLTMKYVTPVPLSFDINAKLQYRDFLWIGGSLRPKDGFAAMLGLGISSALSVGYSYDFTTSRLNTVSNGTHEIVVGFLLGNQYGDWCPKNIW